MKRHITEVINTSSVGLYMIDLPLPLPGFSYQITSLVASGQGIGEKLPCRSWPCFYRSCA